jgi:hypothetical protein
VKFRAFLFAAALATIATLTFKAAGLAAQESGNGRQHFVCNTGYTLNECDKQMAKLRKALERYPTRQLGEWTWVLVRSADWKPIVLARGFDPDTPAFSFLPKRETFLEEALVSEVPTRAVELIARWNMGLDRLLDLAVSHEMGHALCGEKEEDQADRLAKLLREGKTASCRTKLATRNQPAEEKNSAAIR